MSFLTIVHTLLTNVCTSVIIIKVRIRQNCQLQDKTLGNYSTCVKRSCIFLQLLTNMDHRFGLCLVCQKTLRNHYSDNC